MLIQRTSSCSMTSTFGSACAGATGALARGERRRRGRRGLLVLAATGAIAYPAAPAQAAEQHAYAAAYNYATPVVTAGKGDTLSFNNLDSAARHDLVSDDGKFASPLVAGGDSAPVNGVHSLDPGAYKFHCSLHSWTHGVLQVGEQGGAAPTPSPEATMLPTDSAPDPADIFPPADPGPLGGGEWRQYGRDATSTRDGGASGPSQSDVLDLGVVWSYWSHMGDFTGTPAVADGKVFAGSTMGWVYALDAVTGKPLW